jgi:hypothetical protein
VSRNESRSKVGIALLCVIVSVGVLGSSGCAYFTPAFVTHPSRAAAERGVLVCERLSLVRSECSLMPQSEVSRMLSEISGRY